MPATIKQKSKRRNQKQADLRLIGTIVVLVAVFAALIIYAVYKSTTPTAPPGTYSDIPQQTTSDGAPILGNPNTKIVLMEVADFSCPHCLEYHSTILQIIDQYVRPGKVRLEYRPVTFVGQEYTGMGHNPSDTAAQAALCAGEQGHFWEMEDQLFNIQETQTPRAFVPDTMIAAAHGLNLDTTAFTRCLSSGETEKTILTTSDVTNQLGVTGTPTMLYSTDGGKTFQYWPDPSTQDNKMRGGVTLDVIDNTINSAGS